MAELRNDPAHDFLEVQVTEPAVFLRASPTDEGGWSAALIRGVLTLTLANAVPISSIQVELEGHAATTWKEGKGPGRIEKSEEYTVYSASTVLFTLAPGVLTPHNEDSPLDTRDQPSQNQETPPSYTTTEGGGVASVTVSSIDLLSSAESGPPRIQPDLSSIARLNVAATIDQAQEASPRSLPEINEESTTERPYISTATSRNRSPEHNVPIVRDHDRGGRSPSKSSSTTIVHVFDAIRERARSLSCCGVSLPGSTPTDRSEPDRSPSTAQERSQSLAGANASQVTTDSPSCCTTLESNSESREIFQRGVYNYPFCFTLPANSPPTTRTEYGSFTWRLNATVKRSGGGSRSTLFMTADREVEVVYSPIDEEFLETPESWYDPIQVQRILDAEFACTFSFLRNVAPMGERFPVKLEALSLSRLRVYAFDVYVYLYEFARYYDRSGALVRKKLSRTVLSTFGYSQHTPSDVQTFPPSPWYIRTYPRLPGATQGFHASSPMMNSEDGMERNLKNNVRITHIMEVLIRVERGDEGLATGEETPYVISSSVNLSCCLSRSGPPSLDTQTQVVPIINY
ncbi:hypothetical protein F5141DRAFT_1212607 [Pisolithus sp. B1]|nr:hypothetical protein F5141DRAFT_1212607 [Pisolithus sp. B1]